MYNCLTIRYDTIGEFNVDWKAEYSALSSTRSQKKKLKQPTPVPLLSFNGISASLCGHLVAVTTTSAAQHCSWMYTERRQRSDMACIHGVLITPGICLRAVGLPVKVC